MLPILVGLLFGYNLLIGSHNPTRISPIEDALLLIASIGAVALAERRGHFFNRLLQQLLIVLLVASLFSFFLIKESGSIGLLWDVLAIVPPYATLNIFIYSLTVATTEEIVFRKYLLDYLLERVPVILAVVISTIAYSLAHFSLTPIHLFFGVLSSCVVIRYRSWIAVVILHMISNIFFYLYSFINASAELKMGFAANANTLYMAYFRALTVFALLFLIYFGIVKGVKRIAWRHQTAKAGMESKTPPASE